MKIVKIFDCGCSCWEERPKVVCIINNLPAIPTTISLLLKYGSHDLKKKWYLQYMTSMSCKSRCFPVADHQNWFGIDENLGSAVAVSLRREKVLQSHTYNGFNNQGETTFIQPRNIDPEKDGKDQWMYRILVRTSDLLPLRGCVLEESIPALRSEKIKSLPTKEVLEFVCPELQLSR